MKSEERKVRLSFDPKDQLNSKENKKKRKEKKRRKRLKR